MRISSFSTVRPQMSSTRTYEDFYKFLGEKPARLGIVSSLYEQYTASYLTESLMNIYTMEKDKKNSFQSINSFMVEWDINVGFIKRIPFLQVPDGDGAQGTDIIFHFPENYYQRNDVMIIEGSRQQVIFLSRPVRRSDRDWEIVGKLQDSDYNATLDVEFCQPGMKTRFLTNYQPEMHEEGYVKYQSNVEKHRTFIATHRADVDYTAKYRAMEDVFIQIGKGTESDPVYKMNAAEKDCLDSFMAARANALLWGKTNVDKNGKPKIFDPETGEPIISGDGIIPQIERFAGKYVYSKMTNKVMNTAILAMIAKSNNPTGNKYIFICNTPMWANDYIKVGATYNSYEYAGNTVTFKVDRALDIEFPEKKYGIFLDLTADAASGKPAIAMFTFKNNEFCHNWLEGVGRRSGRESGPVASPVAATKLIDWGYAGVGVFNPYRSFILVSEK